VPQRRIGQVFVHLFVREAADAFDGCVRPFRGQRHAFRRELNEHALGVADLVRLQTGEVIGDHFGKHRQHAVGQINAGRAVTGFEVESRLDRHKMRDIRNVHDQLPMAIVQSRERNRIVEITGVDRIDGDDRLVRQVAAVRHRFIERLGLFAGVLQHFFRKRVGEIELADNRQRVDSGLPLRPQHFHHHAFARVPVGRKANHLHHHLIAGADRLRAGIADGNRVFENFAVDGDHAVPPPIVVHADKAMRLPFDHVQHHARGAPADRFGTDSHADDVPVGCVLCVVARDEDILRPVGLRARRRFGTDITRAALRAAERAENFAAIALRAGFAVAFAGARLRWFFSRFGRRA
jgi:hypothetical protein